MVWVVVALLVVIAAYAAYLATHRESGATHACDLCDRTFNSPAELEAHLLEHGRVERPTLAP